MFKQIASIFSYLCSERSGEKSRIVRPSDSRLNEIIDARCSFVRALRGVAAELSAMLSHDNGSAWHRRRGQRSQVGRLLNLGNTAPTSRAEVVLLTKRTVDAPASPHALNLIAFTDPLSGELQPERTASPRPRKMSQKLKFYGT